MKTRVLMGSLLLMSWLLAVGLLEACKKQTDSVTAGATVTALTCGSATFSTTATGGAAYSGTATVPYTGGNGVAYAAGSAIASTGVTGLNATLQAGNLAGGTGNLTYTITGTPSGSGTAGFALSFGGQTCSLSLPVSASATTPGSSTTTAVDCSTATTTTARVVCAANAFLATLTTAQRAAVVLDFSKANAIKWSNLPCGSSCRVGLQLSTLTTAQVTAALAVVAAASGTTANEGYDEAMQIRLADDYLNANGGGNGYSSGIYFIAFLGMPSTTGTFQFQFGGHHLAINTVYNAGAVQGATPHFEGVEPKSWTDTNGTVYAPLNQEQATMAAMLASLSSTQLAGAKLSTTFSDVVLGPNNDGKFPATKVGIQVSTLSTAQQALVLAAMKPWILDADDATAASLLATYQSELANTYVAYSGNATLTNNADYVRIDGPSVWIEFVCQSGVVFQNQIHYHSIWRDHTRDYGGNFTF